MAVANTKSTAITNFDAYERADAVRHRGRVFESAGTVETLAADDAASVYRLVRVKSSDRITSIKLASDAITGASAADVGLYQTAANGGAVLDADFFATDVDISSGIAFTEVLLEATATDISKCDKALWELYGLSTDPRVDYDICVTVNDVTAAGTISMKVQGGQ